jgi:vancomycin permeability regulator SanA
MPGERETPLFRTMSTERIILSAPMERRRGMWRWKAWLLAAFAFAAAALVVAAFFVEWRYRGRIVPTAGAPPAPVALVFGAGLERGGMPSAVLRQRLDTAVALYRRGTVKKLLLSGDNTDRYHDETLSMRRYVLALGLPEKDVVADHAGVSTYDSCFRARDVFRVRKAILVTQDFHLPRALFVANSLGIESWGVAADAPADWTRRYALRELVARAMAVVLVIARPPARVVGPSDPVSEGRG